jgi:hypothetical protein
MTKSLAPHKVCKSLTLMLVMKKALEGIKGKTIHMFWLWMKFFLLHHRLTMVGWVMSERRKYLQDLTQLRARFQKKTRKNKIPCQRFKTSKLNRVMSNHKLMKTCWHLWTLQVLRLQLHHPLMLFWGVEVIGKRKNVLVRHCEISNLWIPWA